MKAMKGGGFWKLFMMSVLATHLWPVIFFLREVPALLLRHSAGELIGILSYYLVFTLIEAVLIWIILSALAIVLPSRVLRDRIAPRGTAIIFGTILWATPLFLNFRLILYSERGMITWFVVYLLMLILLSLLFIKFEELDHRMMPTIDRLSVLAGIYFCIDLVGMAIVIARNLG